MKEHIFLALSHPRAGRETEFHRWYDAHHLHDVVDFAPGFVRGRRYWAVENQPVPPAPRWSSLAIYDLEADDLPALHAAVKEQVGNFTPSNGVFEDDHSAWVYSPVGDPVSASGYQSVPHGTPGRHLALALSHQKLVPSVDESIARAQVWERAEGGQRAGCDVPYRYLVTLEIAGTDPAAAVEHYAATTRPDAVWLYEPRGEQAVTTPR